MMEIVLHNICPFLCAKNTLPDGLEVYARNADEPTAALRAKVSWSWCWFWSCSGTHEIAISPEQDQDQDQHQEKSALLDTRMTGMALKMQ